MKQKGFTLVELLAIITILSIIALITTPAILRVITNSRKGAFLDSASGLLEAAELYNSKNGGIQEDLDLSKEEELRKLKFNGTPPIGGHLIITPEGKYALYMYNHNFCATKSIYENKVKIDKLDKVENCKTVTGYQNQNLIVHFDALNNTGFGQKKEVSIWKDLSNNSNDGELYNFKSTDWKNNSLYFNGNNTYIDMKNKLLNLFKNSMTFEIVVNLDSSQARGVFMGNHPDNNAVNLEKMNDNGRMWYQKGAISYQTPNDKKYIIGDKITTYTYALNKQAKTLKFYRNGVLIDTLTDDKFSANFDYTNVWIGLDRQTPSTMIALKGYVSAIRIYTKELSSQEITDNYKIDESRYFIK